jgi:hypothetical protein
MNWTAELVHYRDLEHHMCRAAIVLGSNGQFNNSPLLNLAVLKEDYALPTPGVQLYYKQSVIHGPWGAFDMWHGTMECDQP